MALSGVVVQPYSLHFQDIASPMLLWQSRSIFELGKGERDIELVAMQGWGGQSGGGEERDASKAELVSPDLACWLLTLFWKLSRLISPDILIFTKLPQYLFQPFEKRKFTSREIRD